MWEFDTAQHIARAEVVEPRANRSSFDRLRMSVCAGLVSGSQLALPVNAIRDPDGASGGQMKEMSRGIQEVVRRVRGEFLEMPGLRLTSQQARRLWRLDERACEAVLGLLVDSQFLAKTRDGAFVRQDGNSPY